MLRVVRHRHMETLVDRLGGLLSRDAPDDPFEPERVVIQSHGMSRWLAQQLAERLGSRAQRDGVCANVRFEFPGTVAAELIDRALGDIEGNDRWSPDRLVWPILGLLPDVLELDEARPLRAYLELSGEIDRRTFVLCRRIADTFDKYALYRPEMTAAWRDGRPVDAAGEPLSEAQRWQPILWRRLADIIGGSSPDQRFERAIRRLRDASNDVEGLPSRMVLFGTGTLPPAYLRLFAALSERASVTVFLNAPSEALWRAVGGVEEWRQGPVGVHDAADLVRPEHPLLASSGRLARDFQIVLEQLPGGYEDGTDATVPSATSDDGVAPNTVPHRLLQVVQDDIRADRARGAPTARPDDPRRPDPIELDLEGDGSLQIHACHGPARQVEVLHDVLLGLFDDGELEPRDVLVMTPDITRYAPLVTATFGARARDGEPDGPPRIPYRIADRSLRETNPVAEALIALLHLVDSRFEASRVLDLLALAPVRRKFGLSESDVERVADWVAQTGIAWARDEQQRRAMGQPAERIHTWRFGLDRLLLGVAMADEGDRVVDDVTPFDDMESDAVDLLSRLAAFYASLERICERLDEARSIEDWTDVLGDVLTVMTAVPRDEAWLEQQVRGRLSDIVDGSRDADGSASATQLALSAVRSLLEGTIDANPQFVGYETGAVTFCSMIPMRSTPHRVVCMIGMDDDAFPKTARAAGFDLLASAARVGDRSPRDEDRYLFLEAILSARDHLVITYTGRDVRTNEDKPPAVPVGELLDVIDRSVATEDGGPSTRARAQITTEHPLQAFSPRNFGVGPDGQPRPSLSYDAVQLQAARALQHGERTATEFFPEPLPAPEWDDVDAVPIIELDTLLRFYTNPTQWLLNNRLGIRLGEYGRETEDVEPVEAGGLAGWRMGSSRLDARLAGRDIDRWAEATLARGDVPAGTLGRIEIDAVGDIVEELAGRVERVRVDEPESLPLDVTVHGVRIVGRVPDVHEDRILRWQYARMKPKHRLAQWIQLLVAVAAHPQRPLSSRLVARASKGSGAETQSIRMPGEGPAARRDRAVELLEPIVRFYREGQRVPLALFPQASEAYASALRGGAPTEKAVAKARSTWEPNRYGPDGDRVDDHIGLVFGAMSIDDIASQTDFLSIATEIWGPLLEAEVVE